MSWALVRGGGSRSQTWMSQLIKGTSNHQSSLCSVPGELWIWLVQESYTGSDISRLVYP